MKTYLSILFLRIQWMALIVAGGAFCFYARSQGITLNTAPAIHLTWMTATNKAYQVEVSTNVAGDWAPTGGLFEGTGGQVGAYYEATGPGNFFREQETAASGVSWLEGIWQGNTYQASANSVPFTSRISITNHNRSFSGIYSNNFVNCSGNLTLLSYTDTEARFYSSIQSGPCVNGLLVLTRVNTTNVLYNWYHPDGPTVACSFAVLSK